PEKVTPLASLLKISTELLISQINNTKVEGRRKESLNHFLYEWTNTEDVLANDELQLRAETLNIDLSINRYIVLIETNDLSELQISPFDFSYKKTPEEYLLIVRNETDLKRYLKFSKENHLMIGISDKLVNLKQAVRQAQD